MSEGRGTCGTCRFFDASGRTCRLKPPVAVPTQQPNALGVAQMGAVGMFPPTDPDWWCGEYATALSIAPV